MTDHCLLRWLFHARHSPVALRWSRRNRPHLRRHCPAVAFLQQEPRRLAASTKRDHDDVKSQHRCGRAESGLEHSVYKAVELGHHTGQNQELFMVEMESSFDDEEFHATMTPWCCRDLW